MPALPHGLEKADARRDRDIEAGDAAEHRDAEEEIAGRGCQVTDSVALGAGAVVAANAAGSVAIGSGSVASAPDTVSVGASGSERRITNVAAGVNPTDAVNMQQLNAVSDQVNNVSNRVANALRQIDTLRTGVAMSMAMDAVPMNLDVHEQAVTGGIATFEGHTAVGFRYLNRPYSRATVSFGVGLANGSKTSASAGIGFKF